MINGVGCRGKTEEERVVCLGDQKRPRDGGISLSVGSRDSVGRYRDQARGPSVQTSWS